MEIRHYDSLGRHKLIVSILNHEEELTKLNKLESEYITKYHSCINNQFFDEAESCIERIEIIDKMKTDITTMIDVSYFNYVSQVEKDEARRD
jgi:hypothetical protein